MKNFFWCTFIYKVKKVICVGVQNYLHGHIAVMYRDAEFVVLYRWSFNVFSFLNEGSKNLHCSLFFIFLKLLASANIEIKWQWNIITSLIIGKNSLAGWKRLTSFPCSSRNHMRTLPLICWIQRAIEKQNQKLMLT